MERTGFELDGRIEGSTRRFDQEGVGTEEATERSKLTLDCEGGITERQQGSNGTLRDGGKTKG
ncbi:hypothetical protein PC128_g26274 [Phytophthora cactorum]|nr:hypothetical protein PC128_g26274 [Phytophthora cactorum]